MIKISLALIFVLTLTRGYSQDKVHIVTLENPKTLLDLGFVCTEVIDKRADKNKLGNVFKGAGNKNISANFPTNFENYITGVLAKKMSNGEGKSELVFIFHELQISEQRGPSMETGHCRIELEIAKKIDSNLYSIAFLESDIFGEALDVTRSHSQRIDEAINQCLMAFSHTDYLNTSGFLITDEQAKYEYDYSSVPLKGAYVSFGEMARNKPLKNVPVEMEAKKSESKLHQYRWNHSENKAKNYVKFISDGNDIYICMGYAQDEIRFIKSKHIGRYIYFETKSSNFAPSYGFGLMGALMNTLISYKKRGLIIDPTTNSIMELNNYTLYTITHEDHPEILKEYRASSRKPEDLEAAIIKLNLKYQ